MSPVIFQQPEVRDLAWAGFSPLLIRNQDIAGAGLVLEGFWQDRLAELDAEPSPLLDFLAERETTRLGLYYEALWHFLLDEDPDTTLVAHNLPVHDGSRTVGEFDCLYWSERAGTHIHLELAVKFYLGTADGTAWLGPGRRDRLDRKLAHLLQQQSRLSVHPAGRKAIEAVGIDDCQPRIDLKGYLFAPTNDAAAPADYQGRLPLPRWYHRSAFLDLADWHVIPRSHWLSPFLAHAAADQGSLEHALEGLKPGAPPIQLAACDDSGLEQTRCFVTPDDWPNDIEHK